MPPPSSAPAPAPQTTKRLLHELHAFTSSSPSSSTSTPEILAHLAPVSDASLLSWRAILLGPPATPYASGRWLLSLAVPPTYPLHPPVVKFVTPICHPNVHWKTGEICLDLLKDNWSAAYTLERTMEAVWGLLQEGGGEVDSPLNVDLAALVRGGDEVAAGGLVRWCTGEWRYEGGE